MATERARQRVASRARVVSGIALLTIGGVHLYEYGVDHYSAIPTIGTLFLLNAIGGFGLGAWLLTPVARLVSRRRVGRVTAIAAISGIGLAASSLAALLVSESTPLFGFMEQGFRTSIVISIVAELTAIVALATLLSLTVCRRWAAEPGRRTAAHASGF